MYRLSCDGNLPITFSGYLAPVKRTLFVLLAFGLGSVFAQSRLFLPDSTLNIRRQRAVTWTALGGYVGIGSYLGFIWYAQDTLVPFHFFDDSREWKQIDKIGHALGAYSASRWVSDLYRWSGVPQRRAAIRGATIGFLAMSTIEVFDGFGQGWGASFSDIGANFSGSALYLMNQLLWRENRIQLKNSYIPSIYVRNADSLARYGGVFGKNITEWPLKDYNGQAYWLSFRVKSFLPQGSKIRQGWPIWLNPAIGYGADGMSSGFASTAYRQWYLGFDIDLAEVWQKPGWVRTGLSVASLFRLPLPAVEIDKKGMRAGIQ